MPKRVAAVVLFYCDSNKIMCIHWFEL